MKVKLLRRLRAKYHFRLVKASIYTDRLEWCKKSDMVLYTRAVPTAYQSGFEAFLGEIGMLYTAIRRHNKISRRKRRLKAIRIFNEAQQNLAR